VLRTEPIALNGHKVSPICAEPNGVVWYYVPDGSVLHMFDFPQRSHGCMVYYRLPTSLFRAPAQGAAWPKQIKPVGIPKLAVANFVVDAQATVIHGQRGNVAGDELGHKMRCCVRALLQELPAERHGLEIEQYYDAHLRAHVDADAAQRPEPASELAWLFATALVVTDCATQDDVKAAQAINARITQRRYAFANANGRLGKVPEAAAAAGWLVRDGIVVRRQMPTLSALYAWAQRVLNVDRDGPVAAAAADDDDAIVIQEEEEDEQQQQQQDQHAFTDVAAESDVDAAAVLSSMQEPSAPMPLASTQQQQLPSPPAVSKEIAAAVERMRQWRESEHADQFLRQRHVDPHLAMSIAFTDMTLGDVQAWYEYLLERNYLIGRFLLSEYWPFITYQTQCFASYVKREGKGIENTQCVFTLMMRLRMLYMGSEAVRAALGGEDQALKDIFAPCAKVPVEEDGVNVIVALFAFVSWWNRMEKGCEEQDMALGLSEHEVRRRRLFAEECADKLCRSYDSLASCMNQDPVLLRLLQPAVAAHATSAKLMAALDLRPLETLVDGIDWEFYAECEATRELKRYSDTRRGSIMFNALPRRSFLVTHEFLSDMTGDSLQQDAQDWPVLSLGPGYRADQSPLCLSRPCAPRWCVVDQEFPGRVAMRDPQYRPVVGEIFKARSWTDGALIWAFYDTIGERNSRWAIHIHQVGRDALTTDESALFLFDHLETCISQARERWSTRLDQAPAVRAAIDIEFALPTAPAASRRKRKRGVDTVSMIIDLVDTDNDEHKDDTEWSSSNSTNTRRAKKGGRGANRTKTARGNNKRRKMS
jgi:hypothetical protein